MQNPVLHSGKFFNFIRLRPLRPVNVWFYSLLSMSVWFAQTASAAGLATIAVRTTNSSALILADAVVEAERQTVLSAQVSGAITGLTIKAGDHVKTGQNLLQIDPRVARQEARASSAQVAAAQAGLQVATKEFERQKQLFAKQYISQASLERAEAQFLSSSAQAQAQIASASAMQTQTDFYTLKAPYEGMVSEVNISLGDMAQPGRGLMTIFDPSNLRVTANVPQAQAAALAAALKRISPKPDVKISQNANLNTDLNSEQLKAWRIEFPDLSKAQRWVTPRKLTLLPASDAATHTVQLRLELPAGLALSPGMFARVSLPLGNAAENLAETSEVLKPVRLYVPKASVFKRAELSAVYIVNQQGHPVLRQVRAGRIAGDEQEILSGVMAGERVALDPLAAAQMP